MSSRCIKSILASMRMCCSQLKSDIILIYIYIEMIVPLINIVHVVRKDIFSITSLNVATIQILEILF